MQEFMLYGFEQAKYVNVPAYLKELYAKIKADAGDGAVLLVYGSNAYRRTDFKLNAPAHCPLALEDVAIVVIPRDQGSLTITCFGRGSDRQEVTYEFNGEKLVRVWKSA